MFRNFINRIWHRYFDESNPEVDARKHRIHEVIFESHTPQGKLFDVVLFLVIIASVLVVMLESIRDLRVHYGSFFYFLEWAFTLFFTIEYALRVYCLKKPKVYVFSFFGNANFALLISTLIALVTLAKQRNMSFADLAKSTEEALMSGGVIILITAGGGAFGAMLQQAQVGEAIKQLFADSGSGGSISGMGFLMLGFVIAAILKIAQGSSTVAMIVGSSMLAAIVKGDDIGFNYVYLATAIGAGSLFGSWMNDSGFWIFAKMGGLTEAEALKSWSVMLVVLSLVSLLVTILLTFLMPLNSVV